VQDPDGNFYGTTSDNTFTTFYGTVFKITAGGTWTNLYEFRGGLDRIPATTPGVSFMKDSASSLIDSGVSSEGTGGTCNVN
jgi:hypothetical protein